MHVCEYMFYRKDEHSEGTLDKRLDTTLDKPPDLLRIQSVYLVDVLEKQFKLNTIS